MSIIKSSFNPIFTLRSATAMTQEEWNAQYRDKHGDPLPEKHPKLLDAYRYFRVFIQEELKESMGNELPVIPMTRNIKSKSLLEYANEKFSIKNGELIQYKRFDSRGYPQYIFQTEDNIEIVIGPAFINTKYLFPINKK